MVARNEALRGALRDVRRGGVDIDRAPQSGARSADRRAHAAGGGSSGAKAEGVEKEEMISSPLHPEERPHKRVYARLQRAMARHEGCGHRMGMPTAACSERNGLPWMAMKRRTMISTPCGGQRSAGARQQQNAQQACGPPRHRVGRRNLPGTHRERRRRRLLPSCSRRRSLLPAIEG